MTPLTTVVVTLPEKRHHGLLEENEDALRMLKPILLEYTYFDILLLLYFY